MAAPLYTEVTLLDSEENKVYNLKVTIEDAEKAYRDYQFAATLLEHAKSEAKKEIGYSSSILESTSSASTSNESSVSDCNKENENTKEHHHWTKQETLLLIDIYVSKEKELHSGKNTVKHFWENISKEMKKMGYDISGQKCCIKFQAMKRTYKSIKDHNNKSGNNTKKWEYFDIMDKIFNTKSWVEPLSVAGTTIHESDNSSVEESPKQSSSNNKQAKKRKLNVDNYLDQLLEEKRLKREADEIKHKERMEQLKDIRNLLQNFINK